MNEDKARKYFNRNARYYAGGLPPDRKDIYGIILPGGGSVTAEETNVLWERFWKKLQEREKKK